MLSATVVLAACGGGGSNGSASVSTVAIASTTPANGVDPNAPEVVEPGDIPDDQVFVTFPSADGTYSVDVPEGWARTEDGGVITFTDNYNSVTIETVPADTAPTVDSVTQTGLARRVGGPVVPAPRCPPVTSKAGEGILATYEIGSAPNAVTGRKALLAAERYEFFHAGRRRAHVVGRQGCRQRRPVAIVSDSLVWT